MKKKIIVLPFLLICLLIFPPLTTYACNSRLSVKSAYTFISQYSCDTEWRYKTENGKLYRRLYDLTNHRCSAIGNLFRSLYLLACHFVS